MRQRSLGEPMRPQPSLTAAEAAAGVACGRVAAEAPDAEQETYAARPRGRGAVGVSVRAAMLSNGSRNTGPLARVLPLPTCRALRALSERTRLTQNMKSDLT